MARVSIVIPAYNEEGAIGPVLDALKALPIDAEIIVVDDGSTDETAKIATDHGARVIRHAVNGGYGRSVKDGVKLASTDTIIVSDADGTYPIDQIPVLLERFNEGIDMVVGARQGKAYRGSFFKMIGRAFLKKIVEFATGRTIPDVNSGLRVFRGDIAKIYFPDICDGFSFTTTITLVFLLTHRSVAFMPIPYHVRVGRSKVKMFKDTLRTLQYITECIVRYNPLKLFLLLCIFSLVAGALGVFFAGPVSFVFGFFTSIIVFAIGLVAESMRRPRQ